MNLSVLLFGVARDLAQADKLVLDFTGGTTVADLRSRLLADNPRLYELPSFMVAVNQVYASEEAVVEPDDEVAIIPPTSGG